jgi:hypothetical protein
MYGSPSRTRTKTKQSNNKDSRGQKGKIEFEVVEIEKFSNLVDNVRNLYELSTREKTEFFTMLKKMGVFGKNRTVDGYGPAFYNGFGTFVVIASGVGKDYLEKYKIGTEGPVWVSEIDTFAIINARFWYNKFVLLWNGEDWYQYDLENGKLLDRGKIEKGLLLDITVLNDDTLIFILQREHKKIELFEYDKNNKELLKVGTIEDSEFYGVDVINSSYNKYKKELYLLIKYVDRPDYKAPRYAVIKLKQK